MSSVLKGNFETAKKVEISETEIDNLEVRFEKEALIKLGGSIAFVSKKMVHWDDE